MKNKNLLFLYHTDQPYVLFHFDKLKHYFNQGSKFNYADFFQENGLKSLENKISDSIEEKQIDVVFILLYMHKFELRIEFLEKLKKKKYKDCFWLFDDEILQNEYDKYYMQIADTVVTTDYFGRHYYDSIGIPSILYFSAFDKSVYYPQDTKKDIDVSFIGYMDKGNRKDIIQYLKKHGINIQSFGHGSDNGSVTLDEMVTIFNRSKININLTQIDFFEWIKKVDPLIVRKTQNKGRPIEIALTKSFCLSEYSPAICKLFECDKEIVTYTDLDDLVKKIKFYLKNDKLREEIASNAYKKALNLYEYEVYFSTVIKQLEEKIEQKTIEYPILKSELFKKRHIRFLIFKSKIAFSNKRYNVSLELIKNSFQYGFGIFIKAIFLRNWNK